MKCERCDSILSLNGYGRNKMCKCSTEFVEDLIKLAYEPEEVWMKKINDTFRFNEEENISLIVGLNEILRGEKQSSYSNELISKIRDNLVNEQGFNSKTTLSTLKAKEILGFI